MQQVTNLVEEHFKTLFTSEGYWDWGNTLDCVLPSITKTMNGKLTKLVSEDEVKAAIH